MQCIVVTTNICTGAPPHMYANFRHYILLVEGSNVTLTLTINVTTGPSTLFNGSVTWKVFSGTEHDLPPTAKVINYISDGVFHSNLSLYDLSYYNDIGNYTCTASNECGTSSVFAYIDISKGMSLLFVVICCHQLLLFNLVNINCTDSGKIIRSPQDIITVLGEYIQFRCLVQGNLRTLGFSLTSYWQVDYPPYLGHNSTFISDNSTDPYRIAVYPTCEDCCEFASQLTILRIPPELINDNNNNNNDINNNNITISCAEYLRVPGDEPVTHQSASSLSK